MKQIAPKLPLMDMIIEDTKNLISKMDREKCQSCGLLKHSQYLCDRWDCPNLKEGSKS